MSGEELAHFLRSKGIKRSEVSAKLGITRQHAYSLFHSANITTSSLEEVARIVNVRPSEIYRFVEKSKKKLEESKKS